MRFIRQEHIITKICDKIVDDAPTITTIVNNLFKHNIEFSVSIHSVTYSGAGRPLNYDKCRIGKIGDSHVDFLVRTGPSWTKVNNICFYEILEIKAITKKNAILKTNSEVNMWQLMDIDEG